jgi:hypothetical protein
MTETMGYEMRITSKEYDFMYDVIMAATYLMDDEYGHIDYALTDVDSCYECKRIVEDNPRAVALHKALKALEQYE